MQPDAYSVTTPPAAEPVTAAEVRAWMHMDSTADDTQLGTLITAARLRLEEHTGRAMITQTITAAWDDFPDGAEIELPRAPLQTVTSVNVYEDDDTATTLSSASDYHVDTLSEPGRVVLQDGASWEQGVVKRTYHPLRVVYVAGYGAAGSNVPQLLRDGVKELVRAWYDGDAVGDALPDSVVQMVAPFRIWNL